MFGKRFKQTIDRLNMRIKNLTFQRDLYRRGLRTAIAEQESLRHRLALSEEARIDLADELAERDAEKQQTQVAF